MLPSTRVAVVGLGYVGLPLPVEFGRQFDTTGFDISSERVDELRAGRDHTQKTPQEDLAAVSQLRFTTDIGDLAGCNAFIVTVPTPVDNANRPDPASTGKRQHLRRAQTWSVSIRTSAADITRSGSIPVKSSTGCPGSPR